MGKLQLWAFQGNVTEEEDVDVDDAGGVAHWIEFTAEGSLDGLGFGEEGERVGAGVVEVDDGVEKTWGVRRAVLRLRILE